MSHFGFAPSLGVNKDKKAINLLAAGLNMSQKQTRTDFVYDTVRKERTVFLLFIGRILVM